MVQMVQVFTLFSISLLYIQFYKEKYKTTINSAPLAPKPEVEI